MANVIIKQMTGTNGTPLIAPLTPEKAIYDENGKFLSAKMAEVESNAELAKSSAEVAAAKAAAIDRELQQIAEQGSPEITALAAVVSGNKAEADTKFAEILGGEVSENVSATIQKYIADTGALIANDKFLCTDYIAVNVGDKIYYKGYNTYTCVGGYSSQSATGFQKLLAGTGNMESTVTIPEGVSYIVAVGRVDSYDAPVIKHITNKDGELPQVKDDVEEIKSNVGELSELTTEEKDSIVDAINEVNAHFEPDTETFDALDMVMDGDTPAQKYWNIRSGYLYRTNGSSYNCTNPIAVKVGDVVKCSTSISCSSITSSTAAGHVMINDITTSTIKGFDVLPFTASVGEVTITQEMWDAGCRYIAFSFRPTDEKTLTITRVVNNDFVCHKNIVKKVSGTHIAVFTQINSNKYIEFNVKKEGTNTLYWRLQDSYYCKYDGTVFERINRVLSSSENEYVINLTSGATDPHVGGYHGDEVTEMIKFFCDGIAYDIDSLPDELLCNDVYYFEKSNMIGTDLGDSNPIITHYKKTSFSGGYVTANRIVSLRELPVTQFYAGLVCLDRNAGKYWANDNLDITETDDSGGGSGTFSVDDTGSSTVRYWSDTNGISAVICTEIVSGNVSIPNVSIWSRSGSDHDAKYYRRGGGKTIEQGFSLLTQCSVKFEAK